MCNDEFFPFTCFIEGVDHKANLDILTHSRINRRMTNPCPSFVAEARCFSFHFVKTGENKRHKEFECHWAWNIESKGYQVLATTLFSGVVC